MEQAKKPYHPPTLKRLTDAEVDDFISRMSPDERARFEAARSKYEQAVQGR
jgi:hypothetical protein